MSLETDPNSIEQFNCFMEEFIGRELSPEHKTALMNNSEALRAMKQNLKTVFSHARASIPIGTIASQSDAPLGIIEKCEAMYASDTEIVQGAQTTFAHDRLLRSQYEPTNSEHAINLIEMKETLNLDGAWRALLKMKVLNPGLKRIPTLPQIDKILPYLRTHHPRRTCNYLIPVEGIRNQLIIFRVKAVAVESGHSTNDREVTWSACMIIDLDDMFVEDTLPEYNKPEPDYTFVLIT